MTREKAIELIGSMKGDLSDFYDDNDLTALDMAISALSDYDKMQKISLDLAFENDELMNKSRWIPISERLPEKNVEILATTEWGAVTIAEMYSANDWFIHEGTTNADTDEIVAWMPLPKPYKAEKGGE